MRTKTQIYRSIRYYQNGLDCLMYEIKELEYQMESAQAELASHQPEKNRLEAKIKQLQSGLDNPPPNQET